MAITSDSFCNCAIESFCMVLKNAAKFGFVETIATVFMFMCKFCIAIMTTVLAYFMLIWTSPEITYPMVPQAVVFVMAYLVATLFISIFDVGSNTILQCYLIDQDIAKHQNIDAKHIPPTLAKFFDGLDNAKIEASDDETDRKSVV